MRRVTAALLIVLIVAALEEIALPTAHSSGALQDYPVRETILSSQGTISSDNGISSVQSAVAPADSRTATQPSFNCAKASNAIERTICADPELSQWDGRMGEAFKRKYAQFGADQRRILLATQRRWIAIRKSQCDVSESISSRQCILRLTEARVATLEASAGSQSTVPAAISASDVAEKGVPEFLPALIDNVMVGSNDNACPTWNNATQAEEIIVYLTGALENYTDSITEIKANAAQLLNDPTGDPAAAASVNRLINEDQTHSTAMMFCRDAIAKELGLTEVAVRQLYDYNTLTRDDSKMFADLETENEEGSPDFSKLVAMPDQHRALHLIDLEIRDIDYNLNQFRAMVDKDVGNPTEETDRKILANETDFREKLVSVRASIVQANTVTMAAPVPSALAAGNSGDGLAASSRTLTNSIESAGASELVQQPKAQVTPDSGATVPQFVFSEEANDVKNVSDLYQIAWNAAQEANRVYCGRSTPLACSMYQMEANRCAGYIFDTAQILMNLHASEAAGMTPGQAGKEAEETMIGGAAGHYMPDDVLASAIDDAIQVSRGEEVHFAWGLFGTCLKAADQ